MRLKDYLERNALTQVKFINLIEMATGKTVPQGTLAKWIVGSRIPRKEQIETIFQITDGDVEPNDFYDIRK